MKKYILFLFIFGLFIFNTNSANALVAGCTSTSGYSSIDGSSCNPIPGCTSTSGYSSVDGRYCGNLLNITTPSSLPNAKVGQSYSINLKSSGGSSGTLYKWMLSSSGGGSSLPNGMYISDGGNIYGAPTTAGTYSFYILLTSGSPLYDGVQNLFTLTVDPVAVASIIEPSVYLKANGIKDEGGDKLLKVKYGEPVNLSWESNGEYCEGYDYVASSSWNGKKVSSGSEVISNLALGKHTLVMYCYSSKYGKSSDAQNYAKDDHLTVEVVSASTSTPSLDSSTSNTSASSTSGTSSSVIPSSTCVITRTLRLGSRGADVSCLQSRLGLVSDGKFGPRTLIIVKAFQANAGLKADGVVGPRSVKALEVAN